MRVGIVGCGAIGRTIAQGLLDFSPVQGLVLYDKTRARAEQLGTIHPHTAITSSIHSLVDLSDFIVEAASQAAAREVAPLAIDAGKDLLVMSLGALSDDEFWVEMRARAEKSKGRLYVPAGALGGLEVVVAAAEAQLDEVLLTTRKPPEALAGTKYLEEKGFDLKKITKPTVVFKGTAREAVKLFPANVNVAAALSLAGIGFDKTRVRIIADPTVTTNQHHVTARGVFGELYCEVHNLPSPDNPKTSTLAALSAVATIKNAARRIHFGP